MSTNYFRPPTYRTPTTIDNPAAKVDLPELKNVNTSSADYNKWRDLTGGANYQQRQDILAQLAQTGDRSLYQTFLKNMRSKRDTASAALMGYGGISFKTDDLSTPQDESLEIKQQTGITGKKEVEGIQAATAGAASRGIRGRARNLMIGAALQRVSEDARNVINQYARDISGDQPGGLAYEFKQTQDALIGRWGDLYGKDVTDALAEQLRQESVQSAAAQQAEREQAAQASMPPSGRVPGQWGKKAFADNAVKKLQRSGKYPADKYELTVGKPYGKNHWVIMAKRK
jgi:hypothetical protein